MEFEGRSYRNFNRKVFTEALLRCDWSDYYRSNDPEVAWNVLQERFLPILDNMCPVRKFKIKNYRPDWITAELVEQIKDRDYFYQKAKENGNEDDWNVAKHLRNVTNANIRPAKREFILDKLENCGADSKKFWKVIKSVVPTNEGSSRVDISLKDDAGHKLGKKDVAQYINNYFINIGKATLSVPYTNAAQSVAQNSCNDTTEKWLPDEFTEGEVLRLH